MLDEFTYLLKYDWLDVAEVVSWLRDNKPPMLHLIITGRAAPPCALGICRSGDRDAEHQAPVRRGYPGAAGDRVLTAMIARLVIAGTHSGLEKTTLTGGLIAALRQRGLAIQPFKVGPDYIDPSYHTLAAGRACRNLDTWMVPPSRVQALFAHAAHRSDLALIEGVMASTMAPITTTKLAARPQVRSCSMLL